MKAILLDTNAVTALFKGDQRVLDCVSSAERVYVSAIVLGELLAGFRLGTQFERNRSAVDALLACSTVETVSVDSETADYYGLLFVALRKNGTPIPVNDLWIAAQTMASGAVLITYDRHFTCVPGLRVGW